MALTNAAMKEDAQAASEAVTMRKIAPTLRYEGLLLAEMAGTIATFADVPADVLLMGGDMKRPALIKPAFDALAQTLPHCRSALFPGLDHGGTGDPGPSNPTSSSSPPRSSHQTRSPACVCASS